MNTSYSLPARLKAARKAAGYKTSKSFIKAHKIPPSTYSQHETGRRKPDDEILKEYSQLFGVNYDWLKTGIGEPYSNKFAATLKKREMLDGEMLDLNNVYHQSKSHIINESLLAEILKKIIPLYNKKKKVSPSEIAIITAGIYSDIVTLEQSPELQIKMIEPAIRILKRYTNISK